MNEQPKRKTNHEIQIPPDLSPEAALAVIIGLCYEMRHPIHKIEDWASVLSDSESPIIREEAAKHILNWVEGLRYILKLIYTYDEKQARYEDEHPEENQGQGSL